MLLIRLQANLAGGHDQRCTKQFFAKVVGEIMEIVGACPYFGLKYFA